MCEHQALTGSLSGLVLLWAAALFVGCASKPLSVQEQQYADYQSRDADLMLVERFNAKKKRCRRRGGHMVLVIGTGGKVDRRAMELAYCEWGSGVLYQGYGN